MLVLNVNKFYYMRGGAERYYFALTKLLEDNGHDVIPFSMRDERNFPSGFSKYFVSNLEVGQPGLKLIKQASRTIWSREAQAKLSELLDGYKPDLAHLHLLYHHLSPSLLPELKKRKIPVVMTLHDYKLICPNYKLFTQGSACERCNRYKYYNAVTHKCLKNSVSVSALAAAEMSVHKLMKVYEKNVDLFIAPSQFVKDVHVRFGQDPGKITVLPHFIDPAFLTLSDRLPQPASQSAYLLYFGRLAEEKGVDKLLEIMYIYKPSLPLKIAGTGPMEAFAKGYVREKGLADRVEFLGQLASEELARAIKGAAMVLMPSQFYEAFGFSALESIALGTPVVATSQGALPEIITPEVGLTIPVDDHRAFAEAIKEVADWDKTKVMEAGRKLIESRYLPQIHYESLKTMYDHLI